MKATFFLKRFIFIITLIIIAVSLIGCRINPTLSFEKNEIQINVGEVIKLNPHITELEGSDLVDYSLSQEGIVQLEGDMVSAIGVGEVIIKASLKEYPEINAEIKVIVNEGVIKNYWTLIVMYDSKEEATEALKNVGVAIYYSKWYSYLGEVNLDDYKDEEGQNIYDSLAHYYAENGYALNKFEIQNKLIELYNNSANESEKLVEGINYTIDELSEEEFDDLKGNLKEEIYTRIENNENKEIIYKAVIFNTKIKYDENNIVDFNAKENLLYYSGEKFDDLGSSIKSYIKSLSSLYENQSVWRRCYSNGIQVKGNYYVLVLKIFTEEIVIQSK